RQRRDLDRVAADSKGHAGGEDGAAQGVRLVGADTRLGCLAHPEPSNDPDWPSEPALTLMTAAAVSVDGGCTAIRKPYYCTSNDPPSTGTSTPLVYSDTG